MFLFYLIIDFHLIVSIIFEQTGIKIPGCQTLLPLQRLLLFRKIGTETLLLAVSGEMNNCLDVLDVFS